MYCKAGVQCTNPEVYGDIKRGRRLAPSKGLVCPRCQGKCCNEACLEKHKCKQRARPSSSVAMRPVQHQRWQGLDPSSMIDPNTGFLDPNMQLALARAGQGGLLLPQAGGSMMPVIPILPLPLMFNAAALQQAGIEGGLDAAQLQAALAAAGAMGAGGPGMSAPMMLAPLGNQGGADGGVSQALQLAQLQAAGLGGPLLQLTVQPDGMVQAGNGQRVALPPGLMQGMPLQLPGGALQFLSAEQLQGLGADAGGGMPLMQVMPDGTTQVDQAAMNAALSAAAAAGGLDASLLTAMGANLAGLAGVSSSDAQAFLEQQQQLELNVAAAAAAAAAAEGLPPGMGGEGGAEGDQGAAEAAAAAAAAAAAGMQAGGFGADGDGGMGDPNALAVSAAAHSAELQQLVQQQQQQQQLVMVDPDAAGAAAAAAAAAAATASNPDAAAPSAEALPLGADGSSGLVLPGIAPLHMAPELAAALNAATGGRGLYNAEEDTAAAALMSLATDKKNKAAAAAAAAQAAAVAANEGIIPQAVAAQAIEQARQLQAEAEAEAEAEARAQQQQQQQQLLQDAQQQQQQQHLGGDAGGVGDEGVKLEFDGMSQEQLQLLQQQLLQQQQLQMFQEQQQQQVAEQIVKYEQEQEQHYLQQQQHQQQQQQQQQLEAQAQHEQSNMQHHYEQA